MPCEKAVDMLGPTTCALPLHISPLMWWLDAAAVRRCPIKAVRRRPIEKGRFFRSNRGVNTRLKNFWDASKPTVYGRSPGIRRSPATRGARQVYGRSPGAWGVPRSGRSCCRRRRPFAPGLRGRAGAMRRRNYSAAHVKNKRAHRVVTFLRSWPLSASTIYFLRPPRSANFACNARD